MPRLVVVLPLSPLQTGESFAVQSWPLHITVLAPFLTDAAPEEIAQAIAVATSGQGPLTVIAGPEEMFGRRGNVPVTVVVENEHVTRLHRTLAAALRPLAASPDERAFIGPTFRAHVTVKDHDRVHEGNELVLSQVALVDMAPRSMPTGRSVLATFPLLAPG